MSTVTIPKKEYKELMEKKLVFEYLKEIIEKGIFSPPPTKGKKTVIKAFQETGLYKKEFLTSLEKGLSRSNYFRK